MVEIAIISFIAAGLAFRLMRMTTGARANQPLDKKSFLLHVGGIVSLLLYILISRAVLHRAQGQQETISLDILISQAELLRMADQRHEALDCATRALREADRRFGAGDVRTVPALHAYARCLTTDGKPAEAEALFQRALAILVKAHGEDGVEAAEGEYGLGWFYQETKRLDEAEARYRRVVERTERRVGPLPKVLPKALAGLADVLEQKGKTEEAKTYRTRAQAFKSVR